jgi:hypothetical protein
VNFAEQDVAGFRIYAGALEAPQGGYVAGVGVRLLSERAKDGGLVFMNDSLSGGHRFSTANEALRHAIDTGRHVVRVQTNHAAAAAEAGRTIEPLSRSRQEAMPA